ncbi:MAG: ATP-binding protein [Spirochaetia bacterium]|nr:ATP-binding protein [Spirochaetia bacterium]MCI2096155.1 ATP-binding protein [Lactococcus lactis]
MNEQKIEIIPPLSFMLYALRGIGYSLETAIADLIDNSIAANAKNIDVSFVWGRNNGFEPSVQILDDGNGMDAEELISALNFSQKEITALRNPNDLGRFGLGLKLASFSQCKILSVVSKKNGKTHCFRWDLESLKNSKELFIFEGTTPLVDSCLVKLKGKESGTIVIWENLDKIITKSTTYDTFMKKENSVKSHLAMVFHRFLEDHNFKLTVHGNSVSPWSPFPRQNPAARYFPEEKIGIGKKVLVRGCILPPHENVATPELYQIMGGEKGWISQEGFYIYRNRRLLVAGSWLGLGNPRWIQEEAYSLARIQLDIKTSDDFAWKIDVKKSMAFPPEDCTFTLEKIGTDIREQAKKTYLHRGKYSKNDDTVSVKDYNPWIKRNNSYFINNESPFIKNCFAKLSNPDKEVVKQLLQVIEFSVPVRQIMISESEKNNGISTTIFDKQKDEKISAIVDLLKVWMKNNNCDIVEAAKKLSQFELLYDYPDQIEKAIALFKQGEENND